MSWVVNIVRSAEKAFGKLPKKDRERVKDALLEMRDNPFVGDVVWLMGEGGNLRRRVGRWRIIFAIENKTKTLWVKAIEPRTTVSYHKRH